jgi:site-specific DNA-methyltransferase (adenine-specific)
VTGYGDSGGASRFFYVAKPSTEERDRGLKRRKKVTTEDGRDKSIDNPFLLAETERHNSHPTVKPVTLMQYLVRLITPPGGRVLDPFNGSGTTGIACKVEGFSYVGLDREQEYIDISIARAAAWHEKPKTLFE